MGGRGTSKIDEEQVCIDSLYQHFLRKNISARVRKEPDDPPDYWIKVAGVEYAVEITSVVNDFGYKAECIRLHKVIQTELDKIDEFAGTYVLSVDDRPELPKKNSNEWHNLLAEASSWIRNTRHFAPGTRVSLISDSTGRLELEKLLEDGRKIGLGGPMVCKWEVETEEELASLFRKIVQAKRTKIEKKGIPSRCPGIILALYDAYGMASGDLARETLMQAEGYDWFHSIFWSASFSDGRKNALFPEMPGRAECFLFTKNDEWR